MCKRCNDTGLLDERSEERPGYVRAIPCPEPACLEGARMFWVVRPALSPWRFRAARPKESADVLGPTGRSFAWSLAHQRAGERECPAP